MNVGIERGPHVVDRRSSEYEAQLRRFVPSRRSTSPYLGASEVQRL
jgi:hypothetical protein